jgi:hypothetical protein
MTTTRTSIRQINAERRLRHLAWPRLNWWQRTLRRLGLVI